MLFDQAKAFILDKLKTELPLHLTYHNFSHTLDVYHAAENIGALEHIDGNEMQLLLTAALFHDAGFINVSNCHEEESCRLANQYLPTYGYSAGDLKKINGMIMATRLPQLPKNHLEEIIADADLDYLGRDDFFPISDLLYAEFSLSGIVNNWNDWNKLQVNFFEGHHYFTASVLNLRQNMKQQNLLKIKSKIK